MQRLDFAIGTAVASEWLLDTGNPDVARYRSTLTQYFNSAVFDNEMKWPSWQKGPNGIKDTVASVEWLKSKGIKVRGHVMVWPSWQNLPKSLRELSSNPPELQRAVLTHIKDQATKMGRMLDEWDVTNELYAHNDLVKLLGSEAVAGWYQFARACAPKVRLYYNEYTMFHPDGAGVEHFFDTVKNLRELGAPIDALGEQGHIAGAPPGIELILSRLDRFASLGLPIQISEFDINSNDPDFKERYTRDFMTAVFSHPQTVGIVFWGFWEGRHWIPDAAMWDKNWKMLPHGVAFADIVTKEWRSDVDLVTDANGQSGVRAFCGDYQLTVTHDGIRREKKFTLPKEGSTVVVEMN